MIADYTQAITYRLAPEHPFPLPLHDVFHGYLRLLAPPLSIPPENIIFAGDSAGGGLCLALLMYLRDEGYKMPSGIIVMSPWVDLTMSCGSWDENQHLDIVPRPNTGGESYPIHLKVSLTVIADHLDPVGCYLGPKGISKYLTHPYASPLFGDLHDFPPLLIQAGDSEVLRDEITLLAHKATLAGVNVTHELYEDMVHIFQMFTFLPAAEAAIKSIGRWVQVTLPRIEEEARLHKPGRLGVGAGEGMTNEMEDGRSKVVGADGEEVDMPFGQAEIMPDEVDAVRDRGALQLNISRDSEEPSIDIDSLPSSSSGSVTPTGSRARSPLHPLSPDTSDRPSAPLLRRALTAFASSSTLPLSPADSPPPATSVRRRRPTAGSASIHASPAASNPVSPTPSGRRRPRSPTISAQTHPTTRARSMSHSDILHLVEGYTEGGAANETVVYSPGGEIRSVGVLGQQDDDGLW